MDGRRRGGDTPSGWPSGRAAATDVVPISGPVLGVVYISKRAAVASIRATPAAPAAEQPLFYTVKEFRNDPRVRDMTTWSVIP
jgi:hypothetical protein